MLNRPDLVARELGATEERVRALASAVRVRQGLDGAQLVESEVSNEVRLDPVPRFFNAGEIRLTLRASSEAVPEAECRVSGTLVEPSVQWRKEEAEWVGEVSVPLSAGENAIVIRTRSAAGARTTFRRQVKRGAVDSVHRFVLAVGVSRYEDASLNLAYPAQDAVRVAKLLGDRRLSVDPATTTVLTDERATAQDIRDALSALSSSRPEDVVVVYFAGHGVVTDQGEYAFAPQDFDPERVDETGLTGSQIDAALAAIPAQNRVLLLDTCHAGRVTTVDGTGALAPGVRAVSRVVPKKLAERIQTLESVESLFAEVGRRSGTTLIGASSGYEYAFEGKTWEGGVFTYALLDGLRNEKADLDRNAQVTVAELASFLPKRVSELTGGRQTPRTRELNLARNVALRKKLAPIGGVRPDGTRWGTLRQGVAVAAVGDTLVWTDIKKDNGWQTMPIPTAILDHSKGRDDSTPIVRVWFQALDARLVLLLFERTQSSSLQDPLASAWVLDTERRTLRLLYDSVEYPHAAARGTRVVLIQRFEKE
ncbi:MAG: caspase family protein, partial [Myxococcota bacterium]